MGHRYKIKYRVEAVPEGIPDSEIEGADDNTGFTDKIVLFSILEPEGGGSTTAIVSLDGQTDQALSDAELFQAWVALGYVLSQSDTLDPGRRQFTTNVFKVIQQAMLSHRQAQNTPEA